MLKNYFTLLLGLICLNLFGQKTELLDTNKIKNEIKEMKSDSLLKMGGLCISYAGGEENPEIKKKYYESEILIWSELIKRNYRLSISYHNRGLAYSGLGEYKKALFDYNEAIKLDPDAADLYYNKAICKGKLKDFYGAIRDYSLAITKTDDNGLKANILNNRGRAYGDLGEYKKALFDYNEAIKLDPDNADFYYNKAICKGKLKDFYGAIRDYSLAITKTDDNGLKAKILYNRGVTYGDLGEYKKALFDYSLAITKTDDNGLKADILNNRGLAYGDLGEDKKALFDFNEAIKLDPDDAKVYYNKAICKVDLKDFYGAIRDYSLAITKTDDNGLKAEILNSRGVCYMNLKNYDKALQDYNKALELDKTYVFALLNRGLLYAGIFNEKEKGCIDLSKAGENGYERAYEAIKDFCN